MIDSGLLNEVSMRLRSFTRRGRFGRLGLHREIERGLVNSPLENVPAQVLCETYDGVLKGLEIAFRDPSIGSMRKNLRAEARSFGQLSTAQPTLKTVYVYDSALAAIAVQKQSDWLNALREEIKTNPLNPDLENFVNRRQMTSKAWLLEGLKSAFGRELGPQVLIMGGWYGALAMMIDLEGFEFGRIISYDIDDSATRVANRLNRQMNAHGQFQAFTRNVLDVDYASHGKALVINTSAEHMPEFAFANWFSLLPNGSRVLIQSNNYREEPGHVNCVDNLAELSAQAPLTEIKFSGAIQTDRYTRFMLIGVK